MISYTTAQTQRDLAGILALQQKNLASHLTPEEASAQGFLTVIHSLETLQKMNAIEPHTIAKQDEKVIAYLLAMTRSSKHDLPILDPMFQLFDTIDFSGRPVSAYRYIVVGQVCVAKELRGQGILDQCYHAYKERLQPSYDFAITEIATRNSRSVHAHKRIGFQEICRYSAPDGEQWSVVLWEW